LSAGEIAARIFRNTRGFFWSDAYAASRLAGFCGGAETADTLDALEQLLDGPREAPANESAAKRLLAFANSLFMQMPTPPAVRAMQSWSTLTPFFKERVLYSWSDLQADNGQGLSLLSYLQTVFPREWRNFSERMARARAPVADGAPIRSPLARCHSHARTKALRAGVPGSSPHSDSYRLQCRLWAAARGQTLFRTVEGVMQYRNALLLMQVLLTALRGWLM
jgi:callose synthase